jgi:hypothetical protein
MKTSYFANWRNLTEFRMISIALKTPNRFTGESIPELAPPAWLLTRFKKDKNEEAYIRDYDKYVLSKLNPHAIAKKIGEDGCIMCYEKKGADPQTGRPIFCHRHRVAEWLREAGYKIDEV